MGLVQSPGPFAGGSRAGAERLMAALESCQLSLMNVDFCCWPLKSVLLWSWTMQKPNRDPPRLLRDYSFWNLLETYIMPIWESLVSGNGVGVCGILTRSHTSYSPSSQT